MLSKYFVTVLPFSNDPQKVISAHHIFVYKVENMLKFAWHWQHDHFVCLQDICNLSTNTDSVCTGNISLDNMDCLGNRFVVQPLLNFMPTILLTSFQKLPEILNQWKTTSLASCTHAIWELEHAHW